MRGRSACRWGASLAPAIALPIAAAGGPAPFTEEALVRGINHPIVSTQTHWGRGAAFTDLDGDGDADAVILGGPGGVVGVYENNGAGQFINRSAQSGIGPRLAASGVVAGDYDGDGDLDLYISNWATPNALLRNEGNFWFTDVTTAAAVGDAGPGVGCAWGDFDGDGWLDLYVANRSQDAGLTTPNRLYRNLGNGTFLELAAALGVDDGVSPSFQPIFFDFDRDGDDDLYVTTDKGYAQGETNRLFENLGGTFADITLQSGTGGYVDSMGVAVGDWDRDGLFDLYVTNTTPGNLLFFNHHPAMPFSQQAATSGVQCFQNGWGAAFIDYDNDGWLDLFVCNTSSTNCFYEYDGTWPVTNSAAALNLSGGAGAYCVATADIDGDGDLDLLVTDIVRARLYVNHEGANRHWGRLALRGPGPNRFALGAIAEVRVGEAWTTNFVRGAGAYKSHDELILHVGMGEAQMMDQITVSWPGGATRSLTNLPWGQTWTIYHTALLFDADQDGSRDLSDFAVLMVCAQGPLQPGCEMMDGDGDGDIDSDDALAFARMYDGPLHDCNGNGVADLIDLFEGWSPDENGSLIPDECEAQGDVNGDGGVNVTDLLMVLLAWGPCPGNAGCAGDVNFDGTVDVQDLLSVLLNWG